MRGRRENKISHQYNCHNKSNFLVFGGILCKLKTANKRGKASNLIVAACEHSYQVIRPSRPMLDIWQITLIIGRNALL